MGYRKFVFAGEQNGIGFFCPKGVPKALSDVRFTELSVRLHAGLLLEVLKMGDDIFVSSQE